MKEKKARPGTKLTKIGRSYTESIKRKIVEEINCGLITHRNASKKYGINRKSIGNWTFRFITLPRPINPEKKTSSKNH